MNSTVKLSSKYQVVIPQAAREALGLEAGDELLVLVKPDRVVMMPKPKNSRSELPVCIGTYGREPRLI